MARTLRQKAWFGWCMYDWANSAFATVVLAAVLPVYFASLVPAGGAQLHLLGAVHLVPAAPPACAEAVAAVRRADPIGAARPRGRTTGRRAR